MLEKPSTKRTSSASSIFKSPVAALPIAMVVVAVLGWMMSAPVLERLPPSAMASVVKVIALLPAAMVEPVVILEADKVVAAPKVAASL